MPVQILSVHIIDFLYMKYFWVIIIMLFILEPILDKIYRKICVKRLMKKRQCLTNEAILAFYLKSNLSESSILELWNEIAEILNVPVGYLRPKDPLNKIVTIKFFSDDRIEDISDMAIARAKSLNKSIDLEKIVTIDNYVRAFAEDANKLSDDPYKLANDLR